MIHEQILSFLNSKFLGFLWFNFCQFHKNYSFIYYFLPLDSLNSNQEYSHQFIVLHLSTVKPAYLQQHPLGSYATPNICNSTRLLPQFHLNCHHGSYQANCKKIYWRKGSKKAAGHQGCKKICSSHWRSQEAPQIQAWNCCSPWDQKIPEVHWAPHQKTAIPASGERNCPGLQDWP